MCQRCDRRAVLGLGLLGATGLLFGCAARSGRSQALRHVVEPGDTLASLSQRSGLSIAAIIEANRLRSRHLHGGQILWLPGVRALAPVIDPSSQQTDRTFRIIRRQEWGAAELRRGEYDPMPQINRITLHHTGAIPGMQGRSDADLVRAVQRNHQGHNNWADIGYHYLVGVDGLVYEGRPLLAQGAHVGGANNIANIGVAVIGDCDRNLPEARQMATIGALLESLERQHDVDRGRLYAHREFAITVCPGAALYEWFQGYRGRTPQPIVYRAVGGGWGT